MAGFIEIDDTELRRLEVDISGAPGRLQRNARDATVKGLRTLNKVMVADAKGHRHLKGLPKSVSYQLITDLEGEVGMSPGGQGSLAHIVIHGSVNNGPIYDYTRGPRLVQPEIDKIYADAAEDAVFGGWCVMQAVDDVMLPLLRAILPPARSPITQQLEDRVHHGEVTIDNTTKVVSYALPYVVYNSNVGSDETRRLAGRRTRRSVFIPLKFVGETPAQVKWAMQRVRDSIADRRIDIPGHKTWPVDLQSSQRIFRDDDAIRPDGSPLFYGVDEYDLGITLHTFQESGVPT